MAVFDATEEVFTSDLVSYVLYPTMTESGVVGSGDQGLSYTFAGSDHYTSSTGSAFTQTVGARYTPAFGSWTRASRTDPGSLIIAEQGNTAAERSRTLPPWFGDALASVIALRVLPPNWDSYGGLPLDEAHARAALHFLGTVMTEELPLPDFVPLADGGVQLEWDADGQQLTFTSESGHPTSLWLSTESGDREIAADELPNVMAIFRRSNTSAD